jgi:hypothetical protein
LAELWAMVMRERSKIKEKEKRKGKEERITRGNQRAMPLQAHEVCSPTDSMGLFAPL